MTELKKVAEIDIKILKMMKERSTSIELKMVAAKKAIESSVKYFKDIHPSILEEVGTAADLTPGNIVNIKKAYVLESIFNDFSTEEDKKNILLDLVNRELILQKSNRTPIGFVQ